jgi:hypothetical protein
VVAWGMGDYLLPFSSITMSAPLEGFPVLHDRVAGCWGVMEGWNATLCRVIGKSVGYYFCGSFFCLTCSNNFIMVFL